MYKKYRKRQWSGINTTKSHIPLYKPKGREVHAQIQKRSHHHLEMENSQYQDQSHLVYNKF